MLETVFRGIVRGKTIELDQEPALPSGQEVAVLLQPLPSPATAPTDWAAREALRRAAGSWAAEAEAVEQFLDWNRQQRQSNRREISE
ncbi:MAG: hypothetical protein JNM56_34700 [Planctomycetia bacterium]|nr:hypothetical protein [Planctomycetia bacterium]